MRFPKPWYREPRGLWYVTLGGKQHNLGADREQAFARYRELIANWEQQAAQLPSDSVALLIDRFLEWTKNHRAAQTFDWYLHRTASFDRSMPNGLTVGQLKPFHVQQWIDSHPTWSNGHKRGCIRAVQRSLRWAQQMGLIDRNPIAFIEKPKSGKRDQLITADDFQMILSLVRSHVNGGPKVRRGAWRSKSAAPC